MSGLVLLATGDAIELTPTVLAGLALVLFLALVSQAVTGFGASVVLVTLGVYLMPIDQLLPLVLPLTLTQTIYNAARDRDVIDRALLLRRVGPWMGLGMAAGVAIGLAVSSKELRPALGVLVLLLSIREVVRKGDAPRIPLGPWRAGLVMVGAGVAHGLWTTGGPLLVYVLGRESLDKRALRATLAVVWLVLNGALVLWWVHLGRVDLTVLRTSALLLPVLPLGIVLGEWIHHRIDEVQFRRSMFILLAIAAVGLIIGNSKGKAAAPVPSEMGRGGDGR